MDAETVRRLLDYDPVTGNLRWKPRPNLKGRGKSWNSKYAGKVISSINGHGYIQLSIDKRRHEAHRVVWLHYYGKWPKGNIDHRNRVKTDNRISNLRLASVAENAWNSQYVGASVHTQTGRWQSSISLNGTKIFLGLHDSKEQAIASYREAAKRHRGEFAC